MLSSVNGKIEGAVTGKGEYEATGAKLNGDSWIRYEVVQSKTIERRNNAKA
jgi:hypothetical protein